MEMRIRETGTRIVDKLWYRGRLLNRIDVSTDALIETLLRRVQQNDQWRRGRKEPEKHIGTPTEHSIIQINASSIENDKIYSTHNQTDRNDIYEGRIEPHPIRHQSGRRVNSNSVKIPVKKYFYYFYLLFDLIRLPFAAYASNSADFRWYFEYDLLLGIAFKHGLIFPEMLLAVAPISIFELVVDYLVTVVTDAYIWHIASDFLVVNIRHFRELHLPSNIRRRCAAYASQYNPNGWQSFADFFNDFWQIFAIWNIPENALKFRNKLPHYKPRIGAQIRCRAYAISLMCAAAHQTCTFIYGCLLFQVCTLFVGATFSRFTASWRAMTITAISYASLLADFFAQLQCGRYVCLSIHALIIMISVKIYHLRRLRSQLIDVCKRFERDRRRRKHSALSTLLSTALSSSSSSSSIATSSATTTYAIQCFAFFRREHTQIGHDLLTINRRVLRQLLSTTFTCNAMLNMAMIISILFRTMTPFHQLICFTVTVSQVLFTAAAIVPLMIVVNEYHADATLLARCQYNLAYASVQRRWSLACQTKTTSSTAAPYTTIITTTNTIRDKWKLLQCFETINTDRRFYFTIGTVRSVSRHSMIQFTLSYISNLLFAIQLYFNNN